MLPVETAISRFRRDLAVSRFLRVALMGSAVMCLIGGPLLGTHGDEAIPLAAIVAIWVLLSYRSMSAARVAADSPSLIAAGEFELAENHIAAALRTFSLFRSAKLIGMHHLALLRHAQRRWRESTLLCQALLAQRSAPALARSTLLMMTDSMLQMNDLAGAYAALGRLCRQKLNLHEALALQQLQLDYGWRVGAWEQMLSGLGAKLQMSELMPSVNAARSQAYMAVAALKTGRRDLAIWLRRRAELMADSQEITADRPILRELFALAW
ncbi:MAG: hypothetical protein ABSF29_06750 [Tepidisphaeraceae bacterium]|jgi:hypothetical protein